ncbi:MATE family efflux transporter [Candidatus Phytoplasma meliae]|uniref:Multidrug transporter n=1 Tax=Candidatus Phytoplasma meliae TaxID=1848402 RepID=A0ABS5CXJ5_9MOLU|nr:MATE family efflux transporter [Candidatus Phytoplasma meliae]MBP5835713.1 multidrug transporter [Candidatus Phytoplasma meliae]
MIVKKKEQMVKKKFRINEEKKRKFLMEGNLWKVILYVTFPIIIYLVFQALFNSYDIWILQRDKENPRDSNLLSVMNRIHLVKDILIPFGASIATAGVILVGRNYGRKNIEKMRLYLTQTFLVSILIGIIITILCTFILKSAILKYLVDYSSVEPANKADANNYYLIILSSLSCIIMNLVFLSLERAKGNNKMIFWITTLNVAIKIVLSLVLYQYDIFSLKGKIAALAWATFISHTSVTLFAFYFLFLNQNNPLKIIVKKIRFEKKFLKKLFQLAFPICIGIMIYSVGRLVINIIVKKQYSPTIETQLLLAVSVNNIFFNIINSFADSQNAIISQNLGQNNLKRVFETFKKVVIAIFIVALIGTLLHIFFYKYILSLMDGTKFDEIDGDAKTTFKTLFFYETASLWLTCFSNILFSFFTSFEKTKFPLIMNFIRIISSVFLLWGLSSDSINLISSPHKVGLSLFLGNLICIIITLLLFIPFYRKNKNEYIDVED